MRKQTRKASTMVALQDNAIKLNTIITLPADSIKVVFNTRHGWNTEKIIDGYKSHVAEIKESILSEGYKASEPIEIYFKDGEPCVREGHNRLEASQEIILDNPEHIFGEGLPPKHIYCVAVKEPENIIDLLTSQINSNKSAPNTPLDIAKALSVAIKQPVFDDENNEITTKAAKYAKIGKLFGLNSKQSVMSYLEIYELDDIIKDWIQEGLLADRISQEEGSTSNKKKVNLSWTVALTLIKKYKPIKANKILLEAKKIVDKEPEKVDLFGSSVRITWLESLAEKMYPEARRTPPATTAGVQAGNDTDDEDSSTKTENNGTATTTATTNGNGTATTTATTNGNGAATTTATTATKAASENNNEYRVQAALLKLVQVNAKYFVDGIVVESSTFHPSGEYTITLPLDIGIMLQEYLAALSPAPHIEIDEIKEVKEEADVSEIIPENIQF